MAHESLRKVKLFGVFIRKDLLLKVIKMQKHDSFPTFSILRVSNKDLESLNLLYDVFFFLVLSRLLERSIEGEIMKTQDLPSLIISVSQNPKGFKLAWDFLKTNWGKLVKKCVASFHIYLKTLLYVK